jgi:hypothetical protein
MVAKACGKVSSAKVTLSPLDAVAVYSMMHSCVWWLAQQPSSYSGVLFLATPERISPTYLGDSCRTRARIDGQSALAACVRSLCHVSTVHRQGMARDKRCRTGTQPQYCLGDFLRQADAAVGLTAAMRSTRPGLRLVARSIMVV